MSKVVWVSVLLVALAACGSDPSPGGSSRSSSEECAQRRERLVEDVRLPLQRAADAMKHGELDPDSGLVRVSAVLETVVADECVRESVALDTLLAETSPRRVTERNIRNAQQAFAEWALLMGSPEAKINYPLPSPDPCPRMRQEVRASYRVIREPEVGGAMVSMELVLENQGAKVVHLDHGGQVRATHVRPEDRTRTYNWGGSSADTASAPPGRTSTQGIGLVPPGPLQLFPEGRVEVFDLYGSAYSNVGPCAVDVSRAP